MSVLLIVFGVVALFVACALISESRPVRRWANRWGTGGWPAGDAPGEGHRPWGGDGGGWGDGGGGGGGDGGGGGGA